MGSTDIAVSMATGETWIRVPPTMKLTYHGELPRWLSGKDLILHTIGRIGVDGATYLAMEFGGEAVAALDMDDRFTMANMAVEAGAKVGLFPTDERVRDYLASRLKRSYPVLNSDADAAYAETLELDVSSLEPQVSLPHSPANVRPVSQVGEVEIQQAVIGSCTNDRIGDLRAAASVLKGKKVNPGVRCIVVPATQETFLQALREGLVEAFVEAGAVVSTPTCGPCCGGHMGALARGERCISSTNRNFIGRMGSPEAQIYLANPAVVAASAVAGRIISPQEVVRG
jgi:3-isopropylmalate/(R)-2-methylmalate dehydratase large subunit